MTVFGKLWLTFQERFQENSKKVAAKLQQLKGYMNSGAVEVRIYKVQFQEVYILIEV